MAEPEQLTQSNEDYVTYRGKCRELCDAAIKEDPTLTLVRGYYYCPMWNVEEGHWWTTRPDGSIYDPSARQYPSAGHGIYREFDGVLHCSQCGKGMTEEEAEIEGNYCFCSYFCHGRFVGVL